jgi:hypothetical protein
LHDLDTVRPLNLCHSSTIAGSNCPPEVYDPTRWKPEDYSEKLAEARVAEEGRRQRERATARRPEVQFVSSTVRQPPPPAVPRGLHPPGSTAGKAPPHRPSLDQNKVRARWPCCRRVGTLVIVKCLLYIRICFCFCCCLFLCFVFVSCLCSCCMYSFATGHSRTPCPRLCDAAGSSEAGGCKESGRDDPSQGARFQVTLHSCVFFTLQWARSQKACPHSRAPHHPSRAHARTLSTFEREYDCCNAAIGIFYANKQPGFVCRCAGAVPFCVFACRYVAHECVSSHRAVSTQKSLFTVSSRKKRAM